MDEGARPEQDYSSQDMAQAGSLGAYLDEKNAIELNGRFHILSSQLTCGNLYNLRRSEK